MEGSKRVDDDQTIQSSLVYRFTFQIAPEWRQMAVSSLERVLDKACAEISNGYVLTFLDIRLEGDQAHFLVSCGSPGYSPKQIANLVQIMTGNATSSLPPEDRKAYWSRGMWKEGFYVETAAPDDVAI